MSWPMSAARGLRTGTGVRIHAIAGGQEVQAEGEERAHLHGEQQGHAAHPLGCIRAILRGRTGIGSNK